MPLWRVFAHPTTFTVSQKREFAQAITKLYVEEVGLPAFYVNVLFIPLEEDELWIGGEPRKNFVRIVVEQIARQMPTQEIRDGWMGMINQTLKPFIKDRGDLEWEHHISETPRDLWRVGGIVPPPTDSEEEKRWRVENTATEWQT